MPVIEAVDDEGAFITEHPLNLISRGAMLKVPWMTGVTANEALFGVYGTFFSSLRLLATS